MNIDKQIPVSEQLSPFPPPKLFQIIGSVYHTNLQECRISTRAGMWE
jgi:hypothetical protein